jgi:Putative peptidoglycan binding domain
MRKILSCAAIAAMVLLAWGADGAISKGSTSKSSFSKNASKRKLAAASSRTSSHSAGRKAPVKPTTWRNRQLAPKPERYQEIQTALASKGYLKPEDANGAWNQRSVEALTKFQSEQNLGSTGKINSLSLIALGLGPRHDTVPASPAR